MRLILIALFLLVSTPAMAAQQCYSLEQLEAEQGLRIHTELMIIALNCQHLVDPSIQLNHQYEQFTNKNIGLIKRYEDTMRAVFRAEGRPNSESDLNDFRTMLANRIANEAVRLQPNVFCRAYSGLITQANNMDQPHFRKWAQTVFAGYPLTHPMCPGVTPPTQAAPAH